MKFIGHAPVAQSLQKLLQRASLPHALLFTGPDGIGKKKLALHLTQILFCEHKKDFQPCENCSSCERVENLKHPDLLFIEAEEGNIKTELIRELKQKLSFKALEAPLKVAILDDAHEMHPHAANALLKTLEEPPSQSLLILISASPYKLLKTILSRCQRICFSPLSEQEIKKALQIVGFEKWEDPFLLQLADGSPGLALKLSEEAFQKMNQEILPALESQPKDLLKLLSIAEEIAKEDFLAKSILHLLLIKWREKVLQESSSQQIQKFDAIHQALQKIKNTHVNPQLTFENLFLKLCL